MFTAERYHDFSMGHRVYGHESKCAQLHGHNYRITFVVKPEAELDSVGRVIDFSQIKTLLCDWLEENWDHKTLMWERDPDANTLSHIIKGIVEVPFNPTAENMAAYLGLVIAPVQLADTGIVVHSIRVEETRKCSATWTA